MTLKNDATALYVNEDALAVIAGNSSKATSDNFMKVGDNSGGTRSGNLYDWIIWDVSGAYAPGEGTALPSDLTGLPGGGPSSARDLNMESNLSAFPNPFTGTTTIAYSVETTSMTRLDVYDVTGKLVKNLFNDIQVPGRHEIAFSAEGMPAGMYYCRARSDNSVSVVKMLLR